MSKAAIIATGDELLNGITHDTNSHWLVDRLVEIGAEVTRVVIVPDDHKQIISELKAAVEYENDLVITLGGLGPTFDDKTLDAVAEFAERQLVKNPQALEMITAHYKLLHEMGMTESFVMTAEREQMAFVPDGAELLSQQTGAAPGVLLRNVNGTDTSIVSLPGVPAEMREIFTNHVALMFNATTEASEFIERHFTTNVKDESTLAGPLAAFKADNEQLYVKSRGTGHGVAITIGIRAGKEDAARLRTMVASAASTLIGLVGNLGYEIARSAEVPR